jgi:small GTP-binding protein|tara:strand:+ start:2385 stop:2945 length:561 start_codon:yes stop_codon:yes gene_type:complete
VGEFGVGKTSLISNYLGLAPKSVKATVGVDFFTRACNVLGHGIQLNLWDTAGTERFQSLTPLYLRDSVIVFVIYDVGSRQVTSDICKWVTYVDELDIRPFVICVLGNKTDLYETVAPVDVNEALAQFKDKDWHLCTGTATVKDNSFERHIKSCLQHVVQKMQLPHEPVAPILEISVREPSRGTCCT